jgi:hypothetical protein
MQERDIQIRGMQLLRKENMQRLHEELAARKQDQQAGHMQGLLVRHEEEEGLQEQGRACRSVCNRAIIVFLLPHGLMPMHVPFYTLY